jgi:hypothetical protein
MDTGRARDIATPSPFVDAGGTSREARAAHTVTLSGGCLTGVGATGSIGVLAYSTGEPLAVDMTNMTVTGWDYGLVPYGAAATFDASDNAIAGNLTAGFDNTVGGGAQSVEYNWWGAADGPSGAGPGTGDAIDETGFPGSVDFDPFRVDDASTTACAFTPAVNNDVTIVTPAGTQCPEECLTVDVDVTRGDSAGMRGFSITFQLDELALCNGVASVLEGTYLNAIGLTACQVLDNGGGSYTIDCAILGLPCGQDAPTGTLFSLEVISTSTTGATGTITITDVTFRDCDNQPIPDTIGSPASIPMYDTTAPAAITDLAATQIRTGNDTDGTTKIQLDFTAPGDAETVEVYRAGYGDYPEYDAGGMPAVPSYPPGGPWALTSVGTSGDTDEVGNRDYWYFVAFAIDTCGYVSSVSNMTDGTLNYHLGDVTDGVNPGTGDNLVDGLDVSALGASYGNTLVPADPVNYLDVGPTSDNSVHGLPQTDDQLQFEDLIIFAINYGQVSLAPGTPGDVAGASRLAAPELALDVSSPSVGSVLAKVVLQGDGTQVKGAHAVVTYDASTLRLADVTAGDLAMGSDVFLGKIPASGSMTIDAAVLGAGRTFPGEGVIAELRFVAVEPGARPSLGEVALRDASNGPVGAAVAVEPDAHVAPTRLVLGARPNPFRASTHIVLEIPATTEGALRIYDVNGRLVTTLADGTFTAGRHVTAWDGRGTDGRRVASGIYFYTFKSTSETVTKKLLRYE